jgi:dihydrofolate reductase
MAASLDGFIARENDDTSFISKDEWDSYSKIVRSAGNVVVGHRTYEILTKQPEFQEFKDVIVTVVSSHRVNIVDSKHIVASSPKEALDSLRNFDEVIVAGGGILNTSFIEQNLIDEICIDFEPIILGKGIPLFSNLGTEKTLELVGTQHISANELQVRYKILPH